MRPGTNSSRLLRGRRGAGRVCRNRSGGRADDFGPRPVPHGLDGHDDHVRLDPEVRLQHRLPHEQRRNPDAVCGERQHYADYKQQEFINFILSKYIQDGVGELAKTKMRSLIELKYNTIGDAVAELGSPAAIGETFVGFQKHLYE